MRRTQQSGVNDAGAVDDDGADELAGYKRYRTTAKSRGEKRDCRTRDGRRARAWRSTRGEESREGERIPSRGGGGRAAAAVAAARGLPARP